MTHINAHVNGAPERAVKESDSSVDGRRKSTKGLALASLLFGTLSLFSPSTGAALSSISLFCGTVALQRGARGIFRFLAVAGILGAAAYWLIGLSGLIFTIGHE